MNDLGISLIWLAGQVTLVCGAVLVVNLLVRRHYPAAASAATLTGLLVIVGLTAALYSPWPQWQWSALESATQPEAAASVGRPAAETANRVSPSENNPGESTTSANIELESPSAAALAVFLQSARQELTSRSVRQQESGLRWTGWTAAVVLTLMAVGLMRLLAGWASVCRCLQKSSIINDHALREALDVLQAEMSCPRAVELRETEDLVSAATVGWRRPVILLPASWREWSVSERRTVLAHELAHVASGDAASWIAAQFGLLLHFYHPLVHWLVRRLRLEQELAADARAAEVTGGSQTYLTTLAELAVRQPDRPVAWPARAFLPTRGTLLRRIEMLRDTRIRSERASAWRRRMVIAVTVAVGLFIAGIRRPDSGQAMAQQPAAAQVPAAASSFQMQNVPAACQLLVGFRPAQLAMVEDFQPIVEFIQQQGLPPETKLQLSDIDQFLVIGIPTGGVDTPRLSPPIMEIRTTGPKDFQPFIRHQIGETTDQTLEGVTVKSAGDVKSSSDAMTAYVADEQTLLIGRAHVIRTLLASRTLRSSRPAWLEQVETVADAQVISVANVVFARPEMEQSFQRNPNPLLGMVAPLWQNAELVVTGSRFGDEMTLDIHGWGNDDAAATRLKETIDSLVPVATGMLEGAKVSVTKLPAEAREPASQAVDAALAMLETTSVAQDGDHVHLTLTGDGKTMALTGLLLPAIQQAREAARRTQSMNNLKQIMLALHNYHDRHGSFPPSVLLGPDGQTRHSWRVAILPFLDHQELYDQYRLNEPWDSEQNGKLLAQIPPVFHSPNDTSGSTNAAYFALVGENTGFGNTPGEGVRIRDFRDGTSNTLMVFEAKRDIPWTKPEDLAYSPDAALPVLGGFHPPGFNAGLADGSVRFLTESIDETFLRKAMTRNDGHPIEWP